MIRDLCQNVTKSVHNMHVVNTDAKSVLVKTPKRCLQEAAKEKKNMYLEACLKQHQHFLPFVNSADGILDREARATLKRIARYFVTKFHKTYLRTCGYVKIRIAITLMWVTHRFIWGYRLPAHHISVQRPQWEDDAVLNLF